MFTKEEIYYSIHMRKNAKEVDEKNYDTVPYEFISIEAAQRFIDKMHDDFLKQYSEIIIVENINRPMKNIKIK